MLSDRKPRYATETGMKILMVLTSHDRLGDTGKKTGFWLEEFVAPYYAFLDAGAEVTVVSPKGGQPPIDPKSDAPDAQTKDTKRFKNDAEAQRVLANTGRLADADVADFNAVFYPGGHGPLWDLANDADSVRLIETALAKGKPVAAVCHGPAVLKDAKRADGSPLVRDLRVTGFTNSEEAAAGLTEVVPFLLEDLLASLGGKYEKGADFQPHVVRDGLLVTGQNPASSEPAAEAVLELLRKG
jgi:putative intracellular protease/amidase